MPKFCSRRRRNKQMFCGEPNLLARKTNHGLKLETIAI